MNTEQREQAKRPKRKRNTAEDFWASSVADENGCLIWQKCVDGSGYGLYSMDRVPWRAHRLAYTLAKGPIPDGLQLDHLCRVRNCVNPDHLEAVTPYTNALRGLPAIRTACANGHEYTPENTYRVPSTGHRQCRTCRKARNG